LLKTKSINKWLFISSFNYNRVETVLNLHKLYTVRHHYPTLQKCTFVDNQKLEIMKRIPEINHMMHLHKYHFPNGKKCKFIFKNQKMIYIHILFSRISKLFDDKLNLFHHKYIFHHQCIISNYHCNHYKWHYLNNMCMHYYH
jgi:hypothetical protein